MKKLMAIAVLVALTACASIGLSPDTFNQKLAAGYSSVTTVRSVTVTLLENKVINAQDAQNIQNGANNVREGLDVAEQLHKTLPKAGDDKLLATLSVLGTLQKYVDSRQKVK